MHKIISVLQRWLWQNLFCGRSLVYAPSAIPKCNSIPRQTPTVLIFFLSPNVMQGLAKSIAWDGEGATCLIEVVVCGAGSEAEAAKVARSVASSSLTKAAVYGRDPNWGRIACAAGYAGVAFDQNKLRIQLGDILLMENGQPLPFDRSAASNYLREAGEKHGTVIIEISIGDGSGKGQAWGCDLSYDYVKINAEYTT